MNFRSGNDVPAIKRASIITELARTIGRPTRTATSPTLARPPATPIIRIHTQPIVSFAVVGQALRLPAEPLAESHPAPATQFRPRILPLSAVLSFFIRHRRRTDGRILPSVIFHRTRAHPFCTAVCPKYSAGLGILADVNTRARSAQAAQKSACNCGQSRFRRTVLPDVAKAHDSGP